MSNKYLVELYKNDGAAFEKKIKELDVRGVDDLAIFVAHEFLLKRLDWEVASSLVNLIMSMYGREKVSGLFSDIYSAFEGAEIVVDPEPVTRARLYEIFKINP